ncbi:MAG: hypothetical protein WD342_21175 [Verrucomicrobiales bacterium]
MTGTRTKLLRNPEFVHLGAELEKHLEDWIGSSGPENLAGLLDDTCVTLLRDAFVAVGGCEGTVWLTDRDRQHLVAVYNSGSDAVSLVGFEQPIGSGIISLVFSQQQPYCENDILASRGHDDTLDKKVAKRTKAMIAVPFYFGFGLRGVVSCVQLEENSAGGSGYSFEDVRTLVNVTNIVERLIDDSLLSSALGLSDGG